MVLRVATGVAGALPRQEHALSEPDQPAGHGSVRQHPRSTGRTNPGARGGDASRNDASFARCRAELAAGGAMALFPEGVSHSDPQLRPLKTGAARIALSTEAEHDGRLGVTLVPVGLYYERKALFRSSVLLVVGEPIDGRAAARRLPPRRAPDGGGADRDDRRAAGRGRVAGGVARSARGDRARGALDERARRSHDLAAQHQRARELADAYARLRARDPARVEAIAAEVRAYARVLRQMGVRDPWALELAPLRPGALAAAFAKLIVAAPLAALGAVMGWIPYRLAGEVAKRVTRDEDVLGTAKLLAGAAFLAVAWGLEATAAGFAWGARWAAPTFLVGVATGYVALRFEELRREAAEGVAAGRAARVSPPDDAAAGRAPPRARRRGRAAACATPTPRPCRW